MITTQNHPWAHWGTPFLSVTFNVFVQSIWFCCNYPSIDINDEENTGLNGSDEMKVSSLKDIFGANCEFTICEVGNRTVFSSRDWGEVWGMLIGGVGGPITVCCFRKANTVAAQTVCIVGSNLGLAEILSSSVVESNCVSSCRVWERSSGSEIHP